MINYKQPYYLVDFDASVCNFEIYINDMPAFKHHEGGSMASHYPINHFILHTGMQNIRVRVLPIKGESELRTEGHLKIKVFCYDSSTTNYEDTVEAYKYDTPDFEKKAPPPLIEVTSSFSSEVPYKVEGWVNAVSYKDIDEENYKQEVTEYYKKLYQAFKEQNQNKIYEVMLNRFEETDVTMYLDKADNKMELAGLFTTLNSDKFELEPFPESTRIEKFADSKVLNLVSTDSHPVIYYKNPYNEEFSYPILIQKKKLDASFEIIR